MHPDADTQFSTQAMPPRDYPAAYVEELVNQHEWAIDQIQAYLNLSRSILAKLRTQVNPH
jgi:hypothetical protein